MRRRRTQTVLAVLGLLVAAAGVIVPISVPEVRCFFGLDRCPSSSIEIDRVNGDVPKCATFGGHGDVPADKHLWLATREADGDKYFFRPVAANFTDRTWIASKVDIGAIETPAGTPFTVYAVLVDDPTDQELRAEQHSGHGRYAGGVPLPPGFDPVYQIDVKRGTDSTPCKF